jgi:hypothetical protein
VPYVVWGNGSASKRYVFPNPLFPNDRSKDVIINPITILPGVQYVVCDDPVPYPRHRARRRYYQRISVVGETYWSPALPLDGSAFAQKIRGANRLIGVDELIFPLTEGQIANLESAIPLIGSNDLPPSVGRAPAYGDAQINVEWSEVVFAVAGHIDHATATRFFNAVAARNIDLANQGKPRMVKVAWEGYHTMSVWGTTPSTPWATQYDDVRVVDRAMLDKASQFGLESVSWMLGTMTDREDLAEQYDAPHYAACSYDPNGVKQAADEDSFYEALSGARPLAARPEDRLKTRMPVVGVWEPYSSESSRVDMAWAMKQALKRAYA